MLFGLLIGMGIVLPGVSGGVIAVILNVYDKIIFSLNNFFENKKENSVFLAKIIVSTIIGAVISAKILLYFFDKYIIEMSYLFIGLVLGTIPLIIKTYKEKTNQSLNYIVIVLVTIISIVLSIYLKESRIDSNNSILNLFLVGMLYTIGKVIPGISSSVLLTMIGKYELLLNIFSNPISFFITNKKETIIILVGILVGFIISIKAITYFLKKYYSITYSIIIGFVMGSIISLYPNEVSFVGFIYFLIGFTLSLGLPMLKK